MWPAIGLLSWESLYRGDGGIDVAKNFGVMLLRLWHQGFQRFSRCLDQTELPHDLTLKESMKVFKKGEEYFTEE